MEWEARGRARGEHQLPGQSPWQIAARSLVLGQPLNGVLGSAGPGSRDAWLGRPAATTRGTDRGRSSPGSWALPAGGLQPPRLGQRSQQGCPTAPPAGPGRHRRAARRLLAAAARRPRPLRVPAPSAAAAASRLRLLLLREPPPSPPPSLLPPARAQPAPAAPESSRSRSRCPRPRHERKCRRRCRRRRCLSSRGRRALPASVVVSQAGPRGSRAPAPPAPPTAASPARARRRWPPQPSGPRASPGGRTRWRCLRPSTGSRYGV